MPLRITFELGDSDLKHFRLIMREARDAAKNFDQEEIIQAARELLAEVRATKVLRALATRGNPANAAMMTARTVHPGKFGN